MLFLVKISYYDVSCNPPLATTYFKEPLLSLRSFAGLMFYTLFVYNVAFIIHIVLKKIVLSF